MHHLFVILLVMDRIIPSWKSDTRRWLNWRNVKWQRPPLGIGFFKVLSWSTKEPLYLRLLSYYICKSRRGVNQGHLSKIMSVAWRNCASRTAASPNECAAHTRSSNVTYKQKSSRTKPNQTKPFSTHCFQMWEKEWKSFNFILGIS